MTKHLFITLNLLGFALYASAQDSLQVAGNEEPTILRDIEVVKEYTPVIKESGKISTMPELEEVPTQKRTYDFSVWTTPYSIKPSEPPTLDYALAEPEAIKSGKERFAQIGVGTYSSFLGELYTPIFKNDRNLLDFHVNHNSSFGDIKLTDKLYDNLLSDLKSKATNADTRAKISYAHSFKNKELSAFVAGNNHVFKYYGYDSYMQRLSENGIDKTTNDDSLKQAFNRLHANVRFRSRDFISKWKFDCQVNYQLFTSKEDLKEHTIHTSLTGAYRFESSSLHFTFDMHNIIMNLPESDNRYTFERGETLNNYTLIKLLPHYYFSGDLGEITVGVKGAFGIKQGKKGAVMPNVFGRAKLIKDILYVYAGVTGDYTVNNYQNIVDQNLYISPDVRIEDTYTPIDAYVGITLNAARRVNMDLHIGYKLINNPYFFVNKYDTLSQTFTNRFDVVYDENAGVFNAGLSLDYDWTERLNIRFDGSFYKWALKNLDEAWHKPKWEMNIEAMFKATNDLRFRLAYQLQTGRYSGTTYLKASGKTSEYVTVEKFKLPASNNLTLGADYRLLNWLNLFVEFDNVLNQKYESWYGYTQHGFNFMGGVSMIF